ncbi:MAG: hypothetical protein LBC79_05420 [Deltaproteobacteria bacterium]|nr:hypothetical protein [Deltaproteobacteria bacterium]
MSYRLVFCLLLVSAFCIGCGANQSVKNTWKGTKNIWYSYVNVPAAIDYGDKGKMPDYETLFSKAMMGIDAQLLALERTMQNADKPPTPEWINSFFTQFPWVDGITGLNHEGGIVGQAGRTIKTLDFGPLLEKDAKQNVYALKGHVQDADGETAVLLAVPLYDGPDFLGLVVAYFDMRSLMSYSDAPENLIITSPHGLLWSGSSAGVLPNADWGAITRKNSNGTISDASGSYQWVSRFLGNYPLVFAAQRTASAKMPEKAKADAAPRKATAADRDPAVSPASSGAMPPGGDGDDLNAELPPLPAL